MLRSTVATLALCCAVLSLSAADKLELADGSRVVLLGNTFIERDVQFGYIETALTLAYKDKNITFRNLGWSGDTVWGHARAGFGSTQDGYNNLIAQVKDAKPTVLMIAYGMSESFDGDSGLAPFIAQYEKLLNDVASTNAKLVLISPIKHEKLPGAQADADAHNAKLQIYVSAMKDLAAKRGALFVDLFSTPIENAAGKPLTDNGIHLSEYGNALIAKQIHRQLLGDSSNASKNNVRLESDNSDVTLAKLRQLIIEKNTLFFHRWRPQNDTYIFGFRKREQGRNAVDIPKFDPLVEAKEKEIAALKAEVKN